MPQPNLRMHDRVLSPRLDACEDKGAQAKLFTLPAAEGYSRGLSEVHDEFGPLKNIRIHES